MKGKMPVIFVVVSIMLLLAECGPDVEEWTAQSLYPLEENVRLSFEGDGSEYASFYVVMDYREGNRIQRRTDNGGTQSVEVVQVDAGTVERTFQMEEAYYRENMLEKTNTSEVLIMDPIEEGTQWSVPGGRIRTISAVGMEVTTKAGTFNTVEITTEYEPESDVDGVMKEYYAKDVGLVKQVYVTGGVEITSNLSAKTENQEWIQPVIFYYPSDEYQVYDYMVKEVSFETNQITRKTLEEIYKEDAPYPVLTEGTLINWLYLNQDGMVYIDVSREFIDEMNAGAGFEAMTLQALANTVGGYYGVERVLLTVDGGLYESGHIALVQGEYLEVNLENIRPYQDRSDDGSDTEWSAQSLYPLIGNVRYVYEGHGNEYAGYYAVIDYLEGNRIQRRTNNGGTESVEVIQVESGLVERTFQMGEIYYRENMLKKSNTSEILVKDPIEIGNQWSVPNGGTRTITALGVEITTPAGVFDTVEITTEYETQDSGVSKSYYAKDVGLVKESYVFSVDPGGEEEITSTLAQIVDNDLLSQQVPFYYPGEEYEVYEYMVKELTFSTNQITRKTLERVYKEDAPYPVLTEGTLINWLYLNQDGMVYIDVSREFIDEMNAGAGFEAMTLQALANTVGGYYGVDRVLLTVEGGLYESGHIALMQGEYLEVNLENLQRIEE